MLFLEMVYLDRFFFFFFFFSFYETEVASGTAAHLRQVKRACMHVLVSLLDSLAHPSLISLSKRDKALCWEIIVHRQACEKTTVSEGGPGKRKRERERKSK